MICEWIRGATPLPLTQEKKNYGKTNKYVIPMIVILLFMVSSQLLPDAHNVHFTKVDYLDDSTYYIVSFGPIANCSYCYDRGKKRYYVIRRNILNKQANAKCYYGYDVRVVTYYIVIRNHLNKKTIEKNYDILMDLFNKHYNATCELININKGHSNNLNKIRNMLGKSVVDYFVSEFTMEYDQYSHSFNKTMSPEEYIKYIKNYNKQHKK